MEEDGDTTTAGTVLSAAARGTPCFHVEAKVTAALTFRIAATVFSMGG
jgi:hypothetical protein